MNKEQKYHITIEETRPSFGVSFKVELEDHYGNYTCVYEPSLEEALIYAKNWCKLADLREENEKRNAKAIIEMMKLDKEAGITTRFRDGLD